MSSLQRLVAKHEDDFFDYVVSESIPVVRFDLPLKQGELYSVGKFRKLLSVFTLGDTFPAVTTDTSPYAVLVFEKEIMSLQVIKTEEFFVILTTEKVIRRQIEQNGVLVETTLFKITSFESYLTKESLKKLLSFLESENDAD